MAFRKVIWSSADPSLNSAKVQLLQFNLNNYLSVKNQVEIINITDGWWALIGTDESKRKLDVLMDAAKKPVTDLVATDK